MVPTHSHPSYGPCIVALIVGRSAVIVTATGSAIVPRQSVRAI